MMESAAEKPDPTTSSGTLGEDLVSSNGRSTGSGERTSENIPLARTRRLQWRL